MSRPDVLHAMLDHHEPSLGRSMVVETRGLAKRFGEVQAVRSVDLAVPRHSIFGFLGPNGAGKTTTLRMLVGLLQASAGSGRVLGFELGRGNLQLRRRVGYLPQHPRFYPDLTARETLRYAGGFFYRRGPGLERRIDELVELVGLEGRADRPVGVFSGGERQRLGLAQAQLHEPELLILDEPAAGLDPLGRRDVLELLLRLRERTTVLYSTHILDDVQRVSDTVGIVVAGSMVAQAPIDRLLAGTDGTVFHLTLTGAGAGLADELRREHWVTHVDEHTVDGATAMTVAVADDDAADRHLLRLVLADPTVTVADFGRQRLELEDAFVRIVEGQAP